MECPLSLHEIMHDIMSVIDADRRPVVNLKSVEGGCSAQVTLEDGTVKNPDYSYYDPNKSVVIAKFAVEQCRQSCPTVVFEIAYSETSYKLGTDCARWTGATGGNVNLAIGIDIACGPVNIETGHFEDNRPIESIKVSLWTLLNFIAHKRKVQKKYRDCLRRIDRKKTHLPFKYQFTTNIGGKSYTWIVGRTETEVSLLCSLDFSINVFLIFLSRSTNAVANLSKVLSRYVTIIFIEMPRSQSGTKMSTSKSTTQSSSMPSKRDIPDNLHRTWQATLSSENGMGITERSTQSSTASKLLGCTAF